MDEKNEVFDSRTCSSESKMSVGLDYKQLADSLLINYTKGILNSARLKATRRFQVDSPRDLRIINTVQTIYHELDRYNSPASLEKALDTIDLARIYVGVDERERENTSSNLGYEDCVVLELLDYFKNHFFKWVNKPACPRCNSENDDIKPTGTEHPPISNPDEISVIEIYTCTVCQETIRFPRINNPAKLLESRSGRCGEWVNCFLLIMKAVLGPTAQIRYVWNAEDHVWCEYYSSKSERWIHLDPCENVYDEPSLYSNNWGKSMSWVLGIGDTYVTDLSEKYVTDHAKKIPKSTIASESNIERFLKLINCQILMREWEALQLLQVSIDDKYLQLYNKVLLPRAKELRGSKPLPARSAHLPLGRQTGDASWTAARGEDGKGAGP